MKKLLFSLWILCIPAFAQQTYTPFANPRTQFFDTDGNPLSGGLIYTYSAGTLTPKATYQDTLGTVNTNPIVLDSAGAANIWLGTGGYHIIAEDQNHAEQWEIDNVIVSTGTLTSCATLPVFTGDVTNTLCAMSVVKIQGRAVSSSAPADGQFLAWNAAGSQWQPTSPSSVSITLAAPASLFSVSGSPGASITLAYATGQTANRVYGTDVSGNAGLMALTQAQLPITASGNQTVYCSVSGSLTNGHMIVADSNGNCKDGGSTPPSLIQTIRGVSSCTVADGASFNTCSSSYVWPVSFVDTNYSVTCTPTSAPSNPRVLLQGVTSKTTSGIAVQFVTEGSVGGSFTSVDCVGVRP